MDASDVITLFRALVALAIAVYCFILYRNRKCFVNKINQLPGPRIQHLSLLGNLMQAGVLNPTQKSIHLQTLMMEHRRGLCQLYSKEKLCRIWLGHYPMVLIFTPEYAKAFLRSNVLIDKSLNYSFMRTWLGKATFLNTGDSWRSQRHYLTPAFHFKILEDFLPIVNSNCQNLVKVFQKLCDKDWIDVIPVLTMCTLDIFSESSFGVSIKSKPQSKLRYMDDIRTMFTNVGLRSFKPWLMPDAIFNRLKRGKKHEESVASLHVFSRQIIKERREILSKKSENSNEENDSDVNEDDTNNNDNVYLMGKKKRLHSLDLLIDLVKNNKISEKQLQDEIDNLFIAGHDTTRMSIAMTLYLIGLHPDVQEKIVDELKIVFGNDTERPVTFDDISKLKYTECVVKESLRLFPTVPIIGRNLQEDFTIDSYTIPKGTDCFFLLQEIHRDPVEFPDPDRFDPDRFLPENCAKRHPYAYIPFSAGARNCLGQRFALIEERIFVATILRKFKISSLDPLDKLHFIPEIVLFVDQPIRMKFAPR